jgi:hypothetical protein
MVFRIIFVFAFILWHTNTYAKSNEPVFQLVKSIHIIKVKDCVTISEKRKMFNYKKIKKCELQPNSALIFLGMLFKNDKLYPGSFKSITSGDAEQFILNSTSYGVMALRSNQKINLLCSNGVGKNNQYFYLNMNKNINDLMKKNITYFKESKVNYILSLPLESKNKYQFCIAYNNSNHNKSVYVISYSKEFSATFWKNIISSLTNSNSFVMNTLSIGGAILDGDDLDEFAKSYVIGKAISEIKKELYTKLDVCKEGTEKFMCNLAVDVYSDLLYNMYH